MGIHERNKKLLQVYLGYNWFENKGIFIHCNLKTIMVSQLSLNKFAIASIY